MCENLRKIYGESGYSADIRQYPQGIRQYKAYKKNPFEQREIHKPKHGEKTK